MCKVVCFSLYRHFVCSLKKCNIVIMLFLQNIQVRCKQPILCNLLSAVNAATTYTYKFNSGTTQSGTLSIAGSWVAFYTSSSDFVYITASSSVLVAQFSRVLMMIVIGDVLKALNYFVLYTYYASSKKCVRVFH
jgi:hypothetical protein